MKQAPSELASWWKEWQESNDQEAGNKLVQHYMPLVDYQVSRISAHLPKNVDRQDVKSMAFMGLVDALEKFDTNRELKFDTYASFRIKGAIIDGLRKEDWLPRSIRDKSKLIEHKYEEMEQKLGRAPTVPEIAKEANMNEEEVSEIMKDTLFANLLSIEEKSNDSEDDQRDSLRNSIPDEKEETPHQLMEKKENITELVKMIEKLNEKEQLVLSLFYKEELTLTEIGEVMQLSTSRISQIHSRSIAKLKGFLNEVVLT
ncbi:FliA/WhiG family RNA polymerase sigma factor [Halalkalibacillus sediminis]|uniref:FliA/WhiG family RNA polymerase sigma factor n=1 Tax=Halalkalibacillus sediminis TaxID=2018042 RepID=A0A2I0QWE7_9BACI|nr:FliA/WhiG family RNA polymerase sigma factor [Halalkalibacillus sediminis]PKR78645.1 FliA/WhiG family RNA polymerase sigma factor [Halalkalibacillus sediminis]